MTVNLESIIHKKDVKFFNWGNPLRSKYEDLHEQIIPQIFKYPV